MYVGRCILRLTRKGTRRRVWIPVYLPANRLKYSYIHKRISSNQSEPHTSQYRWKSCVVDISLTSYTWRTTCHTIDMYVADATQHVYICMAVSFWSCVFRFFLFVFHWFWYIYIYIVSFWPFFFFCLALILMGLYYIYELNPSCMLFFLALPFIDCDRSNIWVPIRLM